MVPRKNTKTVRPNILVLEALWDDTSQAVRAAGGDAYEETPWTFDDSMEDMRAGFYHGMILTGGSDICPSLYEENSCGSYGIDKYRDFMEYQAMTEALQLGIPVLGICRGSQIMNVFRGGSLIQNIEGHRNAEHPVYAAAGSRTFKRAIGSREMGCISLHHQCVRTCGPGMRVAAYAADGTPEAVESTDGAWLGVQFHPELAAFENGNAFAIFQWLVAEAARYAGGRAPITRFKTARADYEAARNARIAEAKKHQKQLPAPKSSPPKSTRKAGEPSLPSMREATQVIEGSAVFVSERPSKEELQVCTKCGLLFDDDKDRFDHELYVCQVRGVEPPADHPAWNVH